MEALSTFWQVLIAIASGIITIGGAVALLVKIRQPFQKLQDQINLIAKKSKSEDEVLCKQIELNEKKVEELQRAITSIRECEDRTHKEMEKNMYAYVNDRDKEISASMQKISDQVVLTQNELAAHHSDTQLILRSLHSISNHLVTGNSTDKMRVVNDDIMAHLVGKV